MKRSLGIPLLVLLASILLTGTALADTGPKPQLTVKMVNPPEEPYYLDILAEGNYGDAGHLFDGLEWSYTEEERAALDLDLLQALRGAVPDGWHACTAQGSTGAPMWGDLYPNENGLHIFGYMGVPEAYRILVVTRSGETWVSDTYTRKVLQSSVTLDWAGKTVSIPSTWTGYLLQFLATFVPTILIEGILLVLFGYSWRRSWKPFLLVNLVTQAGLALYLSTVILQHGVSPWSLISLFPAEIVIALLEGGLYTRLLTEKSKGRAFFYGILANALSAVLGCFLIEPVWRFIVSIS